MRRVRDGEMTLSRQRALAHSATLATFDKQGRVTIDDKLRQYARLTPGSRVVVSGNLDRAEVWCEELYEHVAASGRGELAGGQE
jgi:DNA-binding transcriptional regulator/RsmH inhibitor MraZ